VPGWRVEVQVFPEFREALSVYWLRRLTKQALVHGVAVVARKSRSLSFSHVISLVIADDDTVHRLNREYRGLDQTTDVLAFPLDNSVEIPGKCIVPMSASEHLFVNPPGEDIYVGEVIISYPQCIKQATARGHSADNEVALLITHGLLHLFGYDHSNIDEEREMKHREVKSLMSLGIKAVYE
jgi:probable rRNA maturation factor